MHILTVTHFYEAHGGGIEKVAGQLCRQFIDAGHTAGWAAGDNDTPPADSAITSTPLRCYNQVERITGLPMPVPGASAVWRLSRAIKRCDAVVIHDALYLGSAAAMIIAWRAGTPVLLLQHIGDIPFTNPILRRVIQFANRTLGSAMLRAANYVAFISATTREAFNHVPTRRPPLALFNGVNTAHFHPATDVAADLATRAAFGLPQDRRLMLFVGRFVPRKGLASIRALAQSQPDLHFALAGRGPIDPASWGLSNVTIISGVSGAALGDLYRAADLLLLPSVGEGYPLVIQEAMACGLPVLCGTESARADPGASAWLAGIEVTLADPQATARRMSDRIDAMQLSAADRATMAAYAAQTYCWRTMAATILSTLEADATSA